MQTLTVFVLKKRSASADWRDGIWEDRMIKNLLIAFGVTFLLALGFGFINGITGQSSGVVTTVLPMTFGILTFLGLQMRAGTRKEAPVDDAVRQAALNAVAPSGQALLYV